MFLLVLVVLFGVGLMFTSVAFAANPVISSISPTPARVGDTVTITGSNFVLGSKVLIWPTIIDAVFVSPTQITFQVPLGTIIGGSGSPSSVGSLYVARPALQGESGDPIQNMGLLSNRVDINLLDTAPTITNISPTTVHVGDVVTLTGSNFDWRTTVQFTDNYAGGLTGFWANAKTYTPTSLSFVIPFGVKGLRTLQVKHAYTDLTSNTIQLNILSIPPVINQILPFEIYYQQNGLLPASSAFRAGVTEGYLYADNIDKDSVLTFDDGTRLYLGSGFGECHIAKGPGNCFHIPSTMAPGAHTMYVKEADSGLTSNTVSLTVTDQPVLVALWPSTKTVFYRGETVNLLGLGFAQSSAALIDGQAGALITMAPGHGYRDLSFSFILPSNISTGSHTVQIKETDSGKVSGSLSFTVIDGSPAPPTCELTADNSLCRFGVVVASTSTPSTTSSLSQTSAETADTPSAPALKQQLVQLITLLLQLVQQAAARGILSVEQLTSILSSIQIPR